MYRMICAGCLGISMQLLGSHGERCALSTAQGASSESPEEPSSSTHARRGGRTPDPGPAAAEALGTAASAALHPKGAFPEPDLEAEREEYEDEGSDGEETT